MRPEVPVAKSPLYALNCSIPHFARGYMLRFSSPEAVFATMGSAFNGSGDSGTPGMLTRSNSVRDWRPEEGCGEGKKQFLRGKFGGNGDFC